MGRPKSLLMIGPPRGFSRLRDTGKRHIRARLYEESDAYQLQFTQLVDEDRATGWLSLEGPVLGLLEYAVPEALVRQLRQQASEVLHALAWYKSTWQYTRTGRQDVTHLALKNGVRTLCGRRPRYADLGFDWAPLVPGLRVADLGHVCKRCQALYDKTQERPT